MSRKASPALLGAWTVMIVALLAVQSADALVDLPRRARGGLLATSMMEASVLHSQRLGLKRNTTVNYFDQLIDHKNPSAGTFKQRWWMDSSAWRIDGPVILYIEGEGRASGSPSGYVAEYGASVNAFLVSLEHRFYGDSMPAPLTNRTMLRHLSVENALADLKAFKDFIETKVIRTKTSWIAAGGSYAGAVSVWLRETYPEDFAASWSSSGVVNAVFDYHAFDGHLLSVMPPACSGAVKEVFRRFSVAFDDDAERAAMMKTFGTPEYFTKGDMAWMLADGAAMAVQYGRKNYLCDHIYPLQEDVFKQYAQILENLYGKGFTSDCYYSTECLSNPSYSKQWEANYAWVYQCCSQLAYWQASYPGSMRTADITTEYFINQCRSAFGDDIFPDTYAFNARFGGATPKIDKVVSLQASDDPWLPAGVMTSLGPDYPRVLAQCSQCGHCGDMHSPSDDDPQSLKDQRAAIKSYLDKWIR